MKQTVEAILYESTHLVEKSLAEDWLKPEEDEAWSHLNLDNGHDVHLS